MAKQTIKLKKYVDIINEYNAEAAITPGMLLEVTTSGTVQKNAVAGKTCAKMFALEDELQGKTIADDYAIADPVQCWSCVPGEEVLAWLADGEDAPIGAKLVSDGTGKLAVLTVALAGAEEFVVAEALEAVDMSGSAGEDPAGRIKVRIL